MRRFTRWHFAGLVAMLVLAFAAGRGAASQPSCFSLSSVRAGDVVFIRGQSLRSAMVRFLEARKSDFSHVGVVLFQDKVPFLIHADPTHGTDAKRGRIRMEPLVDAIAPGRAEVAALYRVTNLLESVIPRVCDEARQYFLRSLDFDGEFDLRTPEKLYCTELVWRAYKAAGVDLCPAASSVSKKYLFPADLIGGQLKKAVGL